MRLYGNSSVPAQDSLRLLLPSTMRLEINRIHASSQLQPDALVFFQPSRLLPLPVPILKIAYFSLQFSPRNSLNGLPSGIFRFTLIIDSPHASLNLSTTFLFPSQTTFLFPLQPPQPQAHRAALRRNRRVQLRSLTTHPFLRFALSLMPLSLGLIVYF